MDNVVFDLSIRCHIIFIASIFDKQVKLHFQINSSLRFQIIIHSPIFLFLLIRLIQRIQILDNSRKLSLLPQLLLLYPINFNESCLNFQMYCFYESDHDQ